MSPHRSSRAADAGAVFYLMVSQVSVAGAGFIMSTIVARETGPHGRGVLAALTLGTFLAAGLGEFGSEYSASHFAARGISVEGIQRLNLRWTLLVAGPTALLAGTLSWAAGLRQLTLTFVLFVIIWPAATIYGRTCRGVLLGTSQIAKAAANRTISPFTSLLVFVPSALLTRSYVTATLVAMIVGQSTSALWSGHVLKKVAVGTAAITRRELFKYGAGVAGWANLQALMLRADFSIVGAFLSVYSLGLYSFASSLSEVVTYGPMAVADLALPRMSARGSVISRRVLVLGGVSSALVIPAGMWLIYPTIARLTTGARFLDARDTAATLTSAAVFLSLGRLAGLSSAANGRPGRMIGPSLVGLGFMLCFDLAGFASGHGTIEWAAVGSALGYGGYAFAALALRIDPSVHGPANAADPPLELRHA